MVTVTETEVGIHVRQDRFLSSGDVKEDENETIWHIPLSLLTTDSSGKSSVNRSVLLDQREATIPLDTSKPFKLNADTVGICSYPFFYLFHTKGMSPVLFQQLRILQCGNCWHMFHVNVKHNCEM